MRSTIGEQYAKRYCYDTEIIGNVTGNLTGNVVGNVLGNFVGESKGIHNGDVIGDVVGNLTGDSNGVHTGNVIGDSNGIHTGNVIGDSNGIHTGNVTGNLTGNSNGIHTGNSTGLHSGTVNVTDVKTQTLTATEFTQLDMVDCNIIDASKIFALYASVSQPLIICQNSGSISIPVSTETLLDPNTIQVTQGGITKSGGLFYVPRYGLYHMSLYIIADGGLSYPFYKEARIKLAGNTVSSRSYNQSPVTVGNAGLYRDSIEWIGEITTLQSIGVYFTQQTGASLNVGTIKVLLSCVYVYN